MGVGATSACAGPACAEAGVLGAMAGVLGSMMALEVIREIVGFGESLVGRLLSPTAGRDTGRRADTSVGPGSPVADTGSILLGESDPSGTGAYTPSDAPAGAIWATFHAILG